jgi:hypothetical protein
MQQTCSSTLQTSGLGHCELTKHRSPGPIGVGVAVGVDVGAGAHWPEDGEQYPDTQSVSLLQGDLSGSCTWQVPMKFVMLQCWPEAHAALQQMLSTQRFGESQCVMPAEHCPPIGTGVGVGVIVGVQVIVGVRLGVGVGVGRYVHCPRDPARLHA